MNETDYLMQKMARAFEMREGRKFSALEKQFQASAAHGATDLSHASCDVPRMEALLRPALLESVGAVALSMAASYFGTLDAVRFLLDRGIREFYDCGDRALPEAPARAGDQVVLPRELRNPAHPVRGRRRQCLRHQHVARGLQLLQRELKADSGRRRNPGFDWLDGSAPRRRRGAVELEGPDDLSEVEGGDVAVVVDGVEGAAAEGAEAAAGQGDAVGVGGDRS